MCVFFAFTGSTVRLLLVLAAALLFTDARDGSVTWTQCKNMVARWPVRAPGIDINATTLLLRSCGIKRFKLSSFDGLPNLKGIDAYDNDIEYLDPAIFSSVSNLTMLFMSYNNLREMPIFGMHSLFPCLEELRLNGNEISKISDPRTFSISVKLLSLHLEENRIEFIHPDVFKPLVNLGFLHLNINRLRYIPESMFQLESLERIFLSHNLIEYVPLGAFRGTKLKELQLQNNRLTYLPSNFVSEFSKTEKGFRWRWFYFFDNPWNCACLLEQIAEVKRLGVYEYVSGKYDGKKPICLFVGRYPCRRDIPSSLISPV